MRGNCLRRWEKQQGRLAQGGGGIKEGCEPACHLSVFLSQHDYFKRREVAASTQIDGS